MEARHAADLPVPGLHMHAFPLQAPRGPPKIDIPDLPPLPPDELPAVFHLPPTYKTLVNLHCFSFLTPIETQIQTILAGTTLPLCLLFLAHENVF